MCVCERTQVHGREAGGAVAPTCSRLHRVMLPRLLHAADVQLLQLPACVLLCRFGGGRAREIGRGTADDLINRLLIRREAAGSGCRGFLGWMKIALNGRRSCLPLFVISCEYGPVSLGSRHLQSLPTTNSKLGRPPPPGRTRCRHNSTPTDPLIPLEKDASLSPSPVGAVGSSCMC